MQNTITCPRILIIDDEERNRKLLDVFMKADGYRTLLVANGQEAIAMAATEPPDLILLDLMMPGMDGFDVARLLKSDEVTKNIPLIIVSSLDDIASRQRMRSSGADAILVKPVDRWALSEKVAALLKAGAGANG